MQPQLFSLYNQENIEQEDLVFIINRHPDLIEQCNLDLIEPLTFAKFKVQNTKILENYDFSNFDSECWGYFLYNHPSFINRCYLPSLEDEHDLNKIIFQNTKNLKKSS